MVADMLAGLNVDNVPDLTGGNPLFNGKIKRRVTKHMANHDLVAVFTHTVNQFAHFCFVGRKGLFQQHVVAHFQKRHSRFNVLMVHCAVDDGVGKFRYAGKRVCVFKAVFFRETEHIHCLFPTNRVGVGNTDDFEQFGVGQRKLGINKRAVTGTHNNGGNRLLFHNFISAIKIESIIHLSQQKDKSHSPLSC